MSKLYNELLTNKFIFNYDIKKYKFEECLKKIFDNWGDSITQLYKYYNNTDNYAQIEIENDTKTEFHKKFYNSPYYNEFLEIYYSLVREEVLPIFNCDDNEFIVQKDPAFRIHLPNNTALGFRPNMNDPEDKIGLHCDADYNHQEGEINFMLTLSGQKGANSCFVETAPGSDNYKSLDMEYGQFISFYGNKCRHYNIKNNTGISRLSIDFRIMPISKYDNTYEKSSIHGKRKFLIGGYYISMKKHDI